MEKYKTIVFFFFFIISILYSFFHVKAEELPLFGKVIYLDAGHGGADPGALYRDIKEKDINLEICKRLMIKLEEKGATVYLTRYGDYDLSVPHAINRKRSDLSRRANIINDSGCDLYLSIHLNAESSGSFSGAQVFYDDVHEDNKRLAEILQKEFQKNTATKRDATLTNSMYMYKRIERVGVLVEVGFLSNANDRYNLKQTWYQNKVSDIMLNGILIYFS